MTSLSIFVARAGLFSRCTLAKVKTSKCWPGMRQPPDYAYRTLSNVLDSWTTYIQRHMPRPRRRYPVPLGISVGQQEFLIDPIQQPRLLFTARLGLEFVAISPVFHAPSPLHMLLGHDLRLGESFGCTQEKPSI